VSIGNFRKFLATNLDEYTMGDGQEGKSPLIATYYTPSHQSKGKFR
jgi:hypothetical protein